MPLARASVASADYEEYDVAALQDAMAAGELTAVELVDYYRGRIEAIDRAGPALASIVEVNLEARATASALDAERAEGRSRGPLHGIPMVVAAAGITLIGDTGAVWIHWAGRMRDADYLAAAIPYQILRLGRHAG